MSSEQQSQPFVPNFEVGLISYERSGTDAVDDFLVISELLNSLPSKFDIAGRLSRITRSAIKQILCDSGCEAEFDVASPVQRVFIKAAQRTQELLLEAGEGLESQDDFTRLESLFDATVKAIAEAEEVEFPSLDATSCPLDDLQASGYGAKYVELGLQAVARTYLVSAAFLNRFADRREDGSYAVNVVSAFQDGALYIPSRIRKALQSEDNVLQDLAMALNDTESDDYIDTIKRESKVVSKLLEGISKKGHRKKYGIPATWEHVDVLRVQYEEALTNCTCADLSKRKDVANQTERRLRRLVARMSEIEQPLRVRDQSCTDTTARRP